RRESVTHHHIGAAGRDRTERRMMPARRIAVQVHPGQGVLACGIALVGACGIAFGVFAVLIIALLSKYREYPDVAFGIAWLFWFAVRAAVGVGVGGAPLVGGGWRGVRRGPAPRHARLRAVAIGGGGAVLACAVAFLPQSRALSNDYELPLLVLLLS